jgi:hypothetical protein
MTSRRRRRASLQRRGTASLEAIIMLPLFLLMFASVYLMHGHFAGRQQAMIRARTCLWDYATRGCPTEDSEKAALQVCLVPKGLTPDEIKVANDDMRPADPYGDTASTRVADVLLKIEKIPVLGKMIGWLFGKPVSQAGYAVVQLPAYAMPERDRFVAAGEYHTMCNSVPKSWGEVGRDIFCSFVGTGTFGC